MEIKADFPDKLQCLFQPKRYKILYGGRGGAKSWGVARALLILGAKSPIRVLCARELQNSIRDSVIKLLGDQVRLLGLEEFYEVQASAIKGKNGTEFGFEGLRHNVTRIKSWEGADYCWIEEAQTVSKSSWATLIPTVRKEKSEIWATFNPDLETDETYTRFVLNTPPDADCVKIGWQDNPWFPEVLAKERDYLKTTDPDAYLNIWEGFCRQALDGAIYAKQIRQAQEENRVTKVHYDASKPVNTFWDLGWADNTSIWFAQSIGSEFRVIDFYQNNQQPVQHYLTILQNKGYVYGTDYLPHDAVAKSMVGRSVEEILRSMGRTVSILPKAGISEGIEAARTIFNRCWFDEGRCQDGLQALRHYRYDVDPDTGLFSKKPLHDIHSHAADAFRYLAIAIQEDSKPFKMAVGQDFGGSWMGR